MALADRLNYLRGCEAMRFGRCNTPENCHPNCHPIAWEQVGKRGFMLPK